MAHDAPDVNLAIDPLATRTMPKGVVVGGAAAVVIGVLALIYGFATSPAFAWGAFLVGALYVIGLAAGGLIFSVIMTVTWGRWGRPLKRLGEAFGLFLPLGWLLLVVFLIGGQTVYPWHPDTIVLAQPIDIEPHSPAAYRTKPLWLSPGFFVVRQILMVALLTVVALVYIRASIRPDLVMAKARLGDKSPASWARWTAGAGELEAEVKAGQHTQTILGPILAALYAVVLSFMAFDLIMTLDPWWYSNMFGGWFFIGCFLSAISAMGVYALAFRDWLGLTPWLKVNVTHDLGKLTLAFTMAWAYTLFAQLLPIWYTNMFESTNFLLVRMHGATDTVPASEWAWMAHLVAVLCFLAPFTILLSRGIKKMRWPLVATFCIILVGMFFERSILVLPGVWVDPVFPTVLFVVVGVGTWLGFVGGFLLVVTWVLSKVPAVPVSDPKLGPHPWDAHVGPIDQRHMQAHS